MEEKIYDHPLSWKALVRVVLVGFMAYLVWRLKSVFVIIFLSLVLTSAIYPIVRFFNKRIPLTLASILTILLIFFPLILVSSLLISTFINELPGFLTMFNRIIESSTFAPEIFGNINFNNYTPQITSYLLSSTPLIANFFITTLTIIFLSLYVLIDSKRINHILLSFIPKKDQSVFKEFIYNLAVINGQYIRGNLFISLICGITTFIALSLIGIPYAVLLSVFVGIMDLLPMVGSVIGAIPAVILGFAISPVIGFLVIAFFIVYQQIENNILAPVIYKKALEISPAISFIAVIIGISLMGVVGALMALPIAASIPVLIQFLKQEKIDFDVKLSDSKEAS